MALRASKTASKESEIETAPLAVDQRKRAEERFRLQVDRQTKRSFATLKDAVDAGAVIKKAHPIVQVSVYDATGGVNQLVGPDGAITDEAETRKEEE